MYKAPSSSSAETVSQSASDIQEDEFEILTSLGQGAFGNVYKVLWTDDGKEYAMKEFKFTRRRDNDKALEEAVLLGRLNHEHIIRFKHAFVSKTMGKFFLVLEYASGGDLHGHIKRKRQEGGAWPTEHIIKWFKQILSGLDYLHRKDVMHRDLKPANILVAEGSILKISDFGLAKELDGSQKQTHSQCGTRVYMAPETFSGVGYSFSADLFALGCVLYEICMLKRAFLNEKTIFHGDLPKIPDASPNGENWLGVSAACSTMLSRDAVCRYSCADWCTVFQIEFDKELQRLEQSFWNAEQLGDAEERAKMSEEIDRLRRRSAMVKEFSRDMDSTKSGSGWTPLGFHNIGNTCWLNSVLQMLTYLPIWRKFHGQTAMCMHSPNSSCALCLMCEHANIVHQKEKNHEVKVPLVPVFANRKNIGLISNNELQFGEQEDAHEFLKKILKPIYPTDRSLQYHGHAKGTSVTSAIKELKKHFGGQKQHHVKGQCGHKSFYEEPLGIMDIILSIDQHQIMSVKNALDEEHKPEILAGSSQWQCDKCQAFIDATKTSLISRLPKILSIALRRFDASRNKTHKNIVIEQELDMNPYTTIDKPAEYKLYGIVAHSGATMNNGHYYSYIRQPDGCDIWWKCDDFPDVDINEVGDFSKVLDDVIDKAYLLFYERKQEKSVFSMSTPNPNYATLIDVPNLLPTPEISKAPSQGMPRNKICTIQNLLWPPKMYDINDVISAVRRATQNFEHAANESDFILHYTEFNMRMQTINEVISNFSEGQLEKYEPYWQQCKKAQDHAKDRFNISLKEHTNTNKSSLQDDNEIWSRFKEDSDGVLHFDSSGFDNTSVKENKLPNPNGEESFSRLQEDSDGVLHFDSEGFDNTSVARDKLKSSKGGESLSRFQEDSDDVLHFDSEGFDKTSVENNTSQKLESQGQTESQTDGSLTYKSANSSIFLSADGSQPRQSHSQVETIPEEK